MINGILLGILTWLSMVVSFNHFPKRLKEFMLKRFVFTDIVSIFITFLCLSSISQSITSVIGSIVCGLLVNITLVVNKSIQDDKTAIKTP